MTVVTIVLLSILLCVVSTDLINRDLLVIYGTGFGELRVTNINTKERIKTFQILIDEISGGLAINYEKDVIFFADKRTVYQLYLIDEFGNRTISGRGDLFTDTKCNHMEKILCEIKLKRDSFNGRIYMKNAQLIKGLSFDRDSNKLFMSYASKYTTKVTSVDVSSVDIDGASFPSTKEVESSYHIYSTDISIGSNPAIFISGEKKRDDCRTHIFRCERRSRSRYYTCPEEYSTYFIEGQTIGLKFTIDKVTNRMFVMQHGSINVLNRNISLVPRWSSFQMKHLNTVVADARFTKGLQAFDVHGGVVVWSSSALGKILVGLINGKGTFIPYEDIYTLDSTSALNSRNIVIF